MANAGITITLAAGGITFTNQWYQTRVIDWKVPVATLILAAAVGMVGELDNRAGVLLSLLILMGASTTKFGGKSFVDTITALTQASGKNQNPLVKTQGKP